MEKEIYKATLVLPHEKVDFFDKVLNVEPSCEEDHYDEDEPPVVGTVYFENGWEADIKVCGVQYREGEYETNTAWSEIVLFDENGYEAGAEIGDDTIIGETWFEVAGKMFYVDVVDESCLESTDELSLDAEAKDMSKAADAHEIPAAEPNKDKGAI